MVVATRARILCCQPVVAELTLPSRSECPHPSCFSCLFGSSIFPSPWRPSIQTPKYACGTPTTLSPCLLACVLLPANTAGSSLWSPTVKGSWLVTLLYRRNRGPERRSHLQTRTKQDGIRARPAWFFWFCLLPAAGLMDRIQEDCPHSHILQLKPPAPLPQFLL